MNSGSLNTALKQGVLDIRFTRRRPRPGVSATRRMLCTLSESILNSVNGRTVLNYLPPANNLPYSISNKNLSMAWDIMMQNFRMIGADSVNILNTYSDDEAFWEYFNSDILPMDTASKMQFMNS